MRTAVFIQGGGVGYDQEQAVRRVLAAAGVPVEIELDVQAVKG
jgi:hypothetical protein